MAKIRDLPGGKCALIGVLLLCTSCSDRSGAGDADSFDRNGPTVVRTSRLPPATEVAAFETIEAFDPVTGQPVPLFRVAGVLVDDESRIYVANAGNHEILALDPSGKLEWRAGGRGRGPAEFTVLGLLQWLPADTIAAIDSGRNLVSYWDTSGRFIGAASFAVPAPMVDEATLFTVPGVVVGALRGRRAVVRGPGRARSEGRPGIRNVATQIGIVGADQRPIATTTVRGADVYELRSPQRMRAILAPMSGATAVTAIDSIVVWARSDSHELVVIEPDGTWSRILQVTQPAERVTGVIRREYLRDWRPWFDVDEPIPMPRALPTFDRVFAARDGPLWARRYHWGGAGERWVVFDVEHGAVRQYHFPQRVQILTANQRTAFGIWRDSLDVEHLVRSPLPEPPASRPAR